MCLVCGEGDAAGSEANVRCTDCSAVQSQSIAIHCSAMGWFVADGRVLAVLMTLAFQTY